MAMLDKDIEILMLKGEKGDNVSSEWGTLTGDIKNQEDLKAELDKKADSESLADVAISGKFEDLKDRPQTLLAYGVNPKTALAELRDLIYPVGSIYMSVNSTSPSEFLGGTWERWGSGKVPVGVQENDRNFETPEKTGGEAIHQLTIEEMPSHKHSGKIEKNPLESRTPYPVLYFSDGESSEVAGRSGYSHLFKLEWDNYNSWIKVTTDNQGGGQAHNNLQPYITCYMWKRTD